MSANDNNDIDLAKAFYLATGGNEADWGVTPLSVKAALTQAVQEKDDLTRIATKDSLTGLPNKYAFDQVTSALKQSGEKAGVFVLDLNKFKPINDTYGHDVGDMFLKVISERMHSVIRHSEDGRTNDQVFRWGGDEFVVVCPGCDADDMSGIENKIMSCFDREISVTRGEEKIAHHLGTSIGGVHYENGLTDNTFAEVDQVLKVRKDESRESRETVILSMNKNM